MPRIVSRLSAPCLLLALALLGACGDDAESAAPRLPSPVQASSNPLDSIPPSELYGATAVENLTVRPVDLDVFQLPAGWDGMRIAALSDLQLGLWEGNEAVATAAVQRAVSLRPDLIVLLGDYIARGQDTLALARVLAPLRGHAALAVLGDRDVRTDSSEARITRVLRDAGVQVLKNSVAPIQRKGEVAYVGGLDPSIVAKGSSDQEYILASMAQGVRTPLLLMHFPPLATRTQTGRWPAILAGNTFCGPMEVPGTPRLSWLDDTALPGAEVQGAERLYLVRKNLMFVTCGVGYGFVPARLGGAPEVALVTLHRLAPAAPQTEQPDTAIPDSVLQRYQLTDTAAADTSQR